MRPALLFAFAASCALAAAEAQFNGRWNIRVPNEPRHRAWWLEISGAGAGEIAGRFVGFPGGDINRIETIAVKDGVLRFRFDRDAQDQSPAVHQEYTARLAAGKLEGRMKSAGGELPWTGERAPEIADRDDGSWTPRQPIQLFNGKDLSGWHGILPGRDLGWSAENGALKSHGGANNLESDGRFWNFALHVEFRIAAQSNSGIGLRGRYEVQIMEDQGRPLDRHSHGALYSRIVPIVAAGKRAGEWQTYDIRLVGRHVTIVLNGTKVVEGVIEGLTAMATDPDEGKPGPITLQGDHGPVEFRSIVLTPLEKP